MEDAHGHADGVECREPSQVKFPFKRVINAGEAWMGKCGSVQQPSLTV